MTPNQIMLVRTTFAQILPIADTATMLFFARLFALDPSLRLVFTTEVQEEGSTLIQMMDAAVRGIDDLETLLPTVRALGRRYDGYGLRGEDYEAVAAALLGTLELGLLGAFTAEAREAWTTTYWLLADAMREGAAEPLPRSA